MPFGDRTGPAGMGPMTGRGMGYCAGYGVPGYMGPGFGRGLGLGRGRGLWGGRGWRSMYYATGLAGWPRYGYWPGAPPVVPGGPGFAPVTPTWTPEDETAALRQQAQVLQGALEDINRRLDELAKSKQGE